MIKKLLFCATRNTVASGFSLEAGKKYEIPAEISEQDAGHLSRMGKGFINEMYINDEPLSAKPEAKPKPKTRKRVKNA